MCPPVVAAATAALAIGGAVAQHVGQNRLASANETAANYNYAQTTQNIGQKAVEQDESTSENAFDTAIAQARSQGRIANSAGDQGLGAQSIVQGMNASMFGIGRQASIEDLNDQNARTQLSEDATGADIARTTQINKVQRSSGLSLALGIGEGVLKGANSYSSSVKAGG